MHHILNNLYIIIFGAISDEKSSWTSRSARSRGHQKPSPLSSTEHSKLYHTVSTLTDDIERTRKAVLTMQSQCFSLELFADLILEINGELKNRMKVTNISKSLIR